MHRLACLLFATSIRVFAAVPAPDRVLTDPHALTSLSNPAATPVPIADLFYTRDSAGAAWSPDGKEIVISTNLTGRYNLWKVSAVGSWPVQLVQSDNFQTGAKWSPDGKTIVFESDHGGDEIADLYAVPSNGGAVVDLTHTDDVSENNALWSPDGKSIAFERKPKTASAIDIAVLDWATRKVRELTHEATADHVWQLAAWSANGRLVYANRINTGFTDASAWRIEVASGKAEELTPHKGQLLIGVTAVSPDGRWLAVTSNAKGGRNQAALFDMTKREYRWLSENSWETTTVEFSADGKQLGYSLNADGRADLFLYDVASGKSSRIDLPSGANEFSRGSFAHDGRVLVIHQASNTPKDWIVSSVGNGGKSVQLTHFGLASLDPAGLPTAQLVHYTSFDGSMISAFVWLPFNMERDGKAPGVVMPHGGPNSQTLDTFWRDAAALASRGYVCISPNVRGSTGYGTAFEQANFKDFGGGDLQDEVHAAKFLAATGYVDAKKIGMFGSSYGGYMTLMAIGKTPSLWAAAVEQYGIIDWSTFLQHSDPFLQQAFKSRLGDPVKDKKIYEAVSPITYIAHAQAPLLVLQGDNDVRVPKEESEQVVANINAHGGVVDVHYYSGEGHGFAKRENQIDALERTIAWFDRYLKGDTNAMRP